MTKKKMRYYMRRYRYIVEAISKDESIAVFKVGERKEIIVIDDTMHSFVNIVFLVLNSEENGMVRKIADSILVKGKKDFVIILEFPISRNSYYNLKNNLFHKVLACCACMGLVSMEEILAESIASKLFD